MFNNEELFLLHNFATKNVTSINLLELSDVTDILKTKNNLSSELTSILKELTLILEDALFITFNTKLENKILSKIKTCQKLVSKLL